MHPDLCKRLVRAQLSEALTRPDLFGNNVTLGQALFPNLYIRFSNRRGEPRLLRIECTNYDFQPVQLEPVDPLTLEPLPRASWWRKQGGGEHPGHPLRDGHPFLCLPGTRDYYTHESHLPTLTGDRWERMRPVFSLSDLVRTVSWKFASGEWE